MKFFGTLFKSLNFKKVVGLSCDSKNTPAFLAFDKSIFSILELQKFIRPSIDRLKFEKLNTLIGFEVDFTIGKKKKSVRTFL